MDRRSFFKLSGLGGAPLCFSVPAFSVVKKQRPPNILYIFTDDQSIRSVSCYPQAHPWIKTPHIDKLAEQGVRFTHCYTGAWCMPSRATALTGKLQHGIESMRMTGEYPNSTYDPEECPFWPKIFRQNGYTTGMIGKWHTGADTGHGRDWDYSAVWDHTQPDIFGGYYENQKLSFDGGPPTAVGGYSTDNYTRYAIEFLNDRAREKKKPWYLWLCYDAVHGPYTPADRHADDYRDTPHAPVPDDIFPPRPTKPDYMKDYCQWEKDDQGNPAGLDKAVRKYNRAVRALDEAVGKVIETLRKNNQLENTLVVFTSDQGFAWGQHGFKWKYAPYDANLRAPLIVRLPDRVPQNKVYSHPVGGQDLIPTFFSFAQIPLPWKMHGHDLTPLFENPGADWDYPVLMENTKYYYGQDTVQKERPGWKGVPWWVFLRKGKYKYIRTLVENEIEELYDLEADPEELVNLALDPDYKELLHDYRRQLIGELQRTDAAMVDHLPSVKT
jgi:arylsulfatase A-like enzyme